MQYNISFKQFNQIKNVDITDLLDKKVDMSDGNCMVTNGTLSNSKRSFLIVSYKEYNDRTIYKKKMV